MTSVGIREFMANVRRYLKSVEAGQEVMVTRNGRPIARLVKESGGKSPGRKRLEELAAKGLVTMPERERRKDVPPPLKVPGKPLSQIVIEDRG
ncbi:MAG: type II toxin-antitoxin system prevent-host-death family antitoxin [Phycisphaerae bacterium]|nr:type II toxin-antitoxin system prevent-host-death family antitoxin [Phycisphaerae bacterium]